MNIINSKWFEIMERFFDLMLLNLLIIICALPMVTSLNAILAGYSVIGEIRGGTCDSVVKSYFRVYRQFFLKKLIINLILFLWVPVLFSLGKVLFSTNMMLINVLYILFSLEVLMSLLGATIDIKKRVSIITLIKNGIIRFHIHWQKYFVISFLSGISMVLVFLVPFLIPIMISGMLYSIHVVLELISRNKEGDIPINFLNVFEKTS